MPRGIIGGFTEGCQQGTKNTSHWRFITLRLCTFKKVWTGFELQFFNIFLCGHATYGPLSLACCWTWKTWALDQATLLITKSGAGGRGLITGQDNNVTQWVRLRPQLRESAGTLSQLLSESKSDCQTQSNRAASGLTCQLQVDNWDLGLFPVRAPQQPAPATGRRRASAPRLSTRMSLSDYLSLSPTVRVPGPPAG